MSDPRLNSMHLPAQRREEFRAARDKLIHACGSETLLSAKSDAPAAVQRTAILRHDAAAHDGAVFVLIDGNTVHPLKYGINTIGRMPDNDIVLTDPYVSRRHLAILVHAQNGCEVHDFASKNGTRVNGKLVEGRAALRAGDRIELSDRTLVFTTNPPKAAEQSSDVTLAE